MRRLTGKQLRYLWAVGYFKQKAQGAPSANFQGSLGPKSFYSEEGDGFAGAQKVLSIGSQTELARKILPDIEKFKDHRVDLIVTSSRKEDRNLARVTVKVYDTDQGRELLRIDRAYAKYDDGDARAIHASFQIDKSLQGQGIGRRAYEQHEKLARDSGMKEIHTQANCDVGGYMWAKMGFDFKWNDESVTYSKILSKKVQRIDRDTVDPSDLEKYDSLAGLWARAVTDNQGLKAREIADTRLRLKSGEEVNLGAETLLRSSWEGVKKL